VANKRAKHGHAKELVLAGASAHGDEITLQLGHEGGHTVKVVLHGEEAAEELYDALGEWRCRRLDEHGEDRSVA